MSAFPVGHVSAALPGPDDPTTPNRSLALLAPGFRLAVEAALAKLPDAMVYEGYRSQQLQAIYYARGRTVKPPEKPVTNAASNLYSWHGYGLAVDVVHRTKFWHPPGGGDWFADAAAVFAQHGIAWGGHWKMRDLPHFQWGACKPSPSDEARRLLATEGIQAVWRALGADGVRPAVSHPPIAR